MESENEDEVKGWTSAVRRGSRKEKEERKDGRGEKEKKSKKREREKMRRKDVDRQQAQSGISRTSKQRRQTARKKKTVPWSPLPPDLGPSALECVVCPPQPEAPQGSASRSKTRQSRDAQDTSHISEQGWHD